MNLVKQNFKQYLKSLNIIHAALLFGQITFAAITLFLNQTNGPSIVDAELENVFFILIPVLFVGSFIASQIIVPKRIDASKREESLSLKLVSYKGTQIVKFAILEGSVFFTIIAYLLFGNYLFISFAGLIMILFVTYYPSKEKIVRELDLNRSEQDLLDDDNAVVAEVTR